MLYNVDLPIRVKVIAAEFKAWHSYITNDLHSQAIEFSFPPT